MRPYLTPSVLLLALALAAPSVRAQTPRPAAPAGANAPLIENGTFANPDPLKGWVTDYAFSGNSNYIGNKTHISVGQDGGKNVIQFSNVGDAGVKMECRAFPLEPGFKYICNINIKGGGYRVYFAGYQWVPGTHPHDNPELGELRMIYQSKALNSMSDTWKQEKLELPGVVLSDAALEYLKKVRYLTLYIWMAKAGAVSSVSVTKVADPTMKF